MNTLVVARRWDGLGARLHALLNAASVARALGGEFRVVWPRNAFVELREPRELFSEAFLARFEIAEFADISSVTHAALFNLSLPQAQAFCRSEAVTQLVMDESFDIFAFAGESADVAQQRFAAGLREIEWSPTVQALIQTVAKASSEHGYAALHIRAGDLVTGDWRQFVPVDKYLPTPLVEFAVNTWAEAERQPMVVVSDNGPYVRYLKNRFPMLRSPEDLIPGYAHLTDVQRAFADILILSQARQLAGPCQSAFSRLAAHLGNLSLPHINEWIAECDARRLLCDGFARAEKEDGPTDVLRPLWARDICWFLDVFSDDGTPAERSALADQAIRFDPNFCGALNRSVLARALSGAGPSSAAYTGRALNLASRSDRHADPMVESLAMSIASTALQQCAPRHNPARFFRPLSMPARIWHLCGRRARNAVFVDLKRSLAQCETLTPFQIHHADALLNLRFQISTLAWLTAADDPVRRMFSVALQQLEGEPPFLSDWRPSGYDTLSWAGCHPQVVRNLELVSIRMARALGIALSHFSPTSPPPALGETDSLLTSPSGLRWVTGWAFDARISRTHIALGYACGETMMSGGVTFLPRPDIAAAINDPTASTCGFAFPVPRSVTDLGDDHRARLRVQPWTKQKVHSA